MTLGLKLKIIFFKIRTLLPASIPPRVSATKISAWLDLNGNFHHKNGPAWVRDDGVMKWYKNGRLHCENGPAKIIPNLSYGYLRGVKSWFLSDRIHRADGPALIMDDGTRKWYQNGHLHRENGPAIEWPDGTKEWWVRGRRHREDGPAICGGPSVQWWYKGKLHRADGPAVITEPSYNPIHNRRKYLDHHSAGDMEWWHKGERHRNDGPAVIKADKTHRWYLHDKLHRTNGPAVEYANGSKEYWIAGRPHRIDGPAFEAQSGYNIWRAKAFRVWELEAHLRPYQKHHPDKSVEIEDGLAPQNIHFYERSDKKELWVKGKRIKEADFDRLYKKRTIH